MAAAASPARELNSIRVAPNSSAVAPSAHARLSARAPDRPNWATRPDSCPSDIRNFASWAKALPSSRYDSPACTSRISTSAPRLIHAERLLSTDQDDTGTSGST